MNYDFWDQEQETLLFRSISFDTNIFSLFWERNGHEMCAEGYM